MLRIQQGLDFTINLRSIWCPGREALVRWNHSERGLLLPGELLNDIRNLELDISLGEWFINIARSMPVADFIGCAVYFCLLPLYMQAHKRQFSNKKGRIIRPLVTFGNV
jgi:hypothetical protein